MNNIENITIEEAEKLSAEIGITLKGLPFSHKYKDLREVIIAVVNNKIPISLEFQDYVKIANYLNRTAPVGRQNKWLGKKQSLTLRTFSRLNKAKRRIKHSVIL